jgi:predicted ATPase
MQPGFRLTSANGPVVNAICRRLDALPLALELAAPWLKVLTAEDLLRQITNDVLLSSVGPRDLPERQQTMNATVAWSYQLLRPEEQRVFRRLGALPGRFSIEAAAAVLGGRTGSPVSSDESLSAVARLDRQKPDPACGDVSGGASTVRDARNRAGVRGPRAHCGR